jgi:hypothetical protein
MESIASLNRDAAPIELKGGHYSPERNEYGVHEPTGFIGAGNRLELTGEDVEGLLNYLVADGGIATLQGIPDQFLGLGALAWVLSIKDIKKDIGVEKITAHSSGPV